MWVIPLVFTKPPSLLMMWHQPGSVAPFWLVLWFYSQQASPTSPWSSALTESQLRHVSLPASTDNTVNGAEHCTVFLCTEEEVQRQLMLIISFHLTQGVICEDVTVQCVYCTVYVYNMMSITFTPSIIIKSFVQTFVLTMSDGEEITERVILTSN